MHGGGCDEDDRVAQQRLKEGYFRDGITGQPGHEVRLTAHTYDLVTLPSLTTGTELKWLLPRIAASMRPEG